MRNPDLDLSRYGGKVEVTFVFPPGEGTEVIAIRSTSVESNGESFHSSCTR